MFIIKTAVGVMAGGIMFGFKSILHLVTPNSYQQRNNSVCSFSLAAAAQNVGICKDAQAACTQILTNYRVRPLLLLKYFKSVVRRSKAVCMDVGTYLILVGTLPTTSLQVQRTFSVTFHDTKYILYVYIS